MHFQISREALLAPLQRVAGAIEKRQTQAILANVLIKVTPTTLSLIGSDTEVELVAHIPLALMAKAGETTVPARKFMDICRAFKDDVVMDIALKEDKLIIKAGRSRFSLLTLPAADFPKVEECRGLLEFTIGAAQLKHILDMSHFAMAQQDVRYFLNGVLLDLRENELRSVATNGHRLALCTLSRDMTQSPHQLIVPRKGVAELLRLLQDAEHELTVIITQHHLRISSSAYQFTSQLIAGRFPSYEALIRQEHAINIQVKRLLLKEALGRVAILSNEKHRGIRLLLRQNQLIINANNPEQEEAEESLDISYQGADLDICFNVNYLIDALAVLPGDDVLLQLTDNKGSLQLNATHDPSMTYVIMPMQI